MGSATPFLDGGGKEGSNIGYTQQFSGFVRMTTSGQVSDAGKPVVICGYGIESGATAAQPYFNNGAALAGSSIVFRPGPITVSQGNVTNLTYPVMFPNGCQVSFDANTTAVTVFYILQSTTT